MEAVRAEGLVRRFGTVQALDGLSFRVNSGEIYGLVGPDGAGKTTAIRILAGLVEPNGGSATVLGQQPDSTDVREHLGLMPQQYSLYGDLTIDENLKFFWSFSVFPEKTILSRRERLLDITRLARFTDRRADSLSGGMYKKLALACSLLHQPKVLLLDEPTNGVDPVSRRELWALLYEFIGEGMAILVSTPYMDEAARCHRLGLIHRGKLVAEGPPRELVREFDHPVVEVEGGDREAIEALVTRMSAIKGTHPVGTRLRLVVAPGRLPEVEEALAPMGGEIKRVNPDFEDVFLAKTGAA